MTQYDLFSPAFKRQAYSTFAEMRRSDPIYAHQAPNGRLTWYITRYEDVVAVLKDNHNFCKDPSLVSEKPKAAALHQRINENMLFADPPNHTRLRALVSQAFTPRRVEAMRSRIGQIVNELLAEIEGSSDFQANGRFELISHYALPLPVRVICDLLGIPSADQNSVMAGSLAIISPKGKGLSYKERRQKVKAFITYLHQLFAQRKNHPQDDMITDLVQAEAAGDRLSQEELSSMVALLLVTGYETTVNLFGNGVLALLQNRAQLDLLLADPTLWEAAIEELLRFDGPVETSTTRWVCHDVCFQGHQMKKGDIMRVVLSSANRDESIFDHPADLDITREAQNKHLAFGLGIHYCLGAPLARLEGVIGLQTLFERFPSLTIEPKHALRWRPGVLFRGLETLPLVQRQPR